jgi:hypothetical protein
MKCLIQFHLQANFNYIKNTISIVTHSHSKSFYQLNLNRWRKKIQKIMKLPEPEFQKNLFNNMVYLIFTKIWIRMFLGINLGKLLGIFYCSEVHCPDRVICVEGNVCFHIRFMLTRKFLICYINVVLFRMFLKFEIYIFVNHLQTNYFFNQKIVK